MNKINKRELNDFHQSKYEYYRTMSICTVIVSVIMNAAYWIFDSLLFGRPAFETLLPRLFMAIPLILYMIASKLTRNYKIMVPLSYIMLHGIAWCTILAIYYSPIKEHANEGFIIMHIVFMAIGFCAPIKYSVFGHCALIFDILISNIFNHYKSIDLMLSLGIPVLVGIEIMLFYMEHAYVEQYLTKKELEQMTMHDQLTKAFNRNKITELCIDGTNQLKEKDTGIIIMDIDYFKKVNDTYGHNIGDNVLKSLVKTVKSCIRHSDCVIRWGGEEFIVLLPECTLDESERIAERIRKAVEECDENVCKFTVSIGVTRYDGIDYAKSINNADKALYYAKEHGRNRIAVYEKMI